MPSCWKKTTFLFVSLLFLFNSSAFALTCNPIYASKYNTSTSAFSPQLYTLTNNVATLAGTATQNLAAISQATDTNIYFDNGANTIIRKYTGSATSNLGTNWLSWTASSGPGGASDGNSYYVGANYHLYQVTTAGVITDKGALVPTSGDTIYSSLKAGDVTADNNGRLYWYASVNGTGVSHLYRIDINTLKATNLGNYGPNAASGAAFNNAGALISTSGSPSSVYAMDLGANSSTNLGTVTGFAANELVYDLASCNLPTLDPNLAITKTVVNITTSQSPATLAIANDVLEYTITVTNNGNLAADTTTLSDTIPTGTTYVAGSTTLNSAAVSDVSGKMPYDPTGAGTREIHSSGQAAGIVQVGAAKAAVVKFRVKLNASGLPASVSNTATTNYPKVTGGATTFVNVTSNSSDVSTSSLPKLTGVVFEDVNYGGGAGRPFSTVGAVGISSARVELYGTAGAFVSSTTTATDGSYSFNALAAGNYYVRVVNNTIKSTRAGSNATERGVQTYRTDGTTATTNEVGGRNPAVVDATSNTTGDTLNTSTFLLSGGGQAQSVQPITLASSDRTGVDFGFNFDTIVNTNDSGQGSLRQFILNSNLLQNTGLAQTGLTVGVETSIFQLTGTAPFTITPIASLPAITDSYTAIDATTQSGTNCATSGRNLVVQLDGTTSGANAQGLTVNADHTLIRGLAIGNYTESGIYASSTGTNLTVQCNNLGLKADGTTIAPNTFYGLYNNGGGSLTVGGNSTATRNIISGNGKDGVRLNSVNIALIQNNYIGTSGDGLSPKPNNQEAADYAGIMLTSSNASTASTTITMVDNVIAGNNKTNTGVNANNTSKGIKLAYANFVSILNNKIGTTPDGMSALANSGYGIYTTNSSDITIGGTTAAERNIISGNQQDGINTRFGTNRITIYGNYIGLGSDGVKAIGNANNGIFLADTSNALIGNSSATGRNIIGSNSYSGIRNTTSNGTKIADNYIGTDVSGTLDRGNTLHGIYVSNANNVVVGGSTNSDANLIIYNKVIGVFTERILASTANTNTLVENNYIGLLKDGETIAGNTQAGIETKNNTGVTVRNNTISGNKTRGVHVVSSPSTTITNNRIGTNAAGTSDKGNLQYGIDINTAAANLTINGNTVSGNDMAGIRLINGDATASAINDNRIGTNLSGTATIPNTLDGIIVDNTPNVFIGSSSGTANTISGNTRNGILINGAASQSIQVLGNLIGLNSAGTSGLANTGEGILVQASASNINIGDGTSTGANKIAYNGGNGISLSGTTPSNVTISRNSLYANQALGIDLGLDQVSLDDTNDADSGANNLLNFPIFKSSQIIGSNLVVSGCAPAGAKIELFEADVSPSSSTGQPAGANQTTLTQDYGEGEAYLTNYTEGVGEDPVSFSCSSLVNTDGNSSTGMSEFQWTLPLPSSLVLGDKITATATLSGTGTSEFSAITTLANPAYDYGDAPATYGVPSHEIVT
uniref:beta strand repeat-containing protein n=1 Tax=uncultured Thiothrix sp. TaxID=223185 RepID=UPI002630D9B2